MWRSLPAEPWSAWRTKDRCCRWHSMPAALWSARFFGGGQCYLTSMHYIVPPAAALSLVMVLF